PARHYPVRLCRNGVIALGDRAIEATGMLLQVGSMKQRRVIIAVAALLSGAAFSHAANAATLDVKTGLWETTSVGETTGMPPIPPEVLAKMTPEQRAQMQASMAAAMGNASKPQVMKSCITEKSLERGLAMNSDAQQHCQRTIVNSTSRMIDAHVVCT